MTICPSHNRHSFVRSLHHLLSRLLWARPGAEPWANAALRPPRVRTASAGDDPEGCEWGAGFLHQTPAGRPRTAAGGAAPFSSLAPRPLTVRPGDSPQGGDRGRRRVRKPCTQGSPPRPEEQRRGRHCVTRGPAPCPAPPSAASLGSRRASRWVPSTLGLGWAWFHCKTLPCL